MSLKAIPSIRKDSDSQGYALRRSYPKIGDASCWMIVRRGHGAAA
jgi:hypothetical protein